MFGQFEAGFIPCCDPPLQNIYSVGNCGSLVMTIVPMVTVTMSVLLAESLVICVIDGKQAETNAESWPHVSIFSE